jgi:hypothetical protein
MALIKFGGGVIQMSGSIAGDTFARNRYGNYNRARTKPTNPNTARQVAARSSIAFLCDCWSSTLTAAQRTAWGLYAEGVVVTNRLGESMKLSGFNHFIRSNSIRKMVGESIISAGPTIFEIPDHDPTFAISASEATQQISFTFDNTLAWASETGGFLFKFVGQPQNAQRNFFGGPWRYCGVVDGDDMTPPSSPDAEDSPFAIAEGQHLWAYARISRLDGRLSEMFRADCFCAA